SCAAPSAKGDDKFITTDYLQQCLLATFLSGIAEFERDLISERVKSGLAVAKARGKRLGRQAGVRPKSDRLLPKVVAMRAEGRSYRWIARELGISKNTVADIVQRHRANA
ncbi:recombinase family protein, partial [Escherichia coli]|nr:recombinase family protein [Escherichia coli]